MKRRTLLSKTTIPLVVRVDITEKETFDKRLEESEQVSHVAMWGRAFWKGTASAEALRNNTEAACP